MEHQVRFLTPEGREGHHSAETLEDALRFVERLRNAEGASEVRVFRVQEIPIEFKTYYKVELRAGESVGEPAPAEADPADGAVANGQAPADPGGEAGRNRLFSRG